MPAQQPRRTTQDWQNADKRTLWHPFTQMLDWQREDPLIIDRAEGFHLIDTEGQRYIDGHASLWVNIHGHQHPAIAAAITAQLGKLDHSTMLGLGNTTSITFAEALLAVTPPGLSRVFYSDSGSTAMEIALKMAFQYWQHKGEPARQKFICFTGAYHGDTIGSVSLGAIELFHERFRPLLFPTIQTPWPRPYHDDANNNDPELSKKWALTQLEEKLRTYAGQIAAVVTEAGVQAADGLHVAPKGFMQAVQALCQQYGVLLIVDEVATGFGRTGKLFSCEHENIQPDIMALAKGISGGVLPLAATLTTEAIYEAYLGEYSTLKTFFHGHSYTGNPLACAAAAASLSLLTQTNLLEELPKKVAALTSYLAPLTQHPHVGEVRQYGLMVGIELVADKVKKTPWLMTEKIPQKIVLAARHRGAIIRPLGPVMVLMPAPAMPLATMAELVEITTQAINDVTMSPLSSF